MSVSKIKFNFLFIFPLMFAICASSCAQQDEGSKNMNTSNDKETIDSKLKFNPTVVFKTTQGEIAIELWPEIAPRTVENMQALVEKNYYDDIIFHRVIRNFMLQTGDPTGTGRGGESIWGGKFEDEVRSDVTFDRRGLLAMANAGPGTNGSQFFITTVKTPHLNMKHTIFGEVVRGYDVVQKIENTRVGQGDRPIEEQKIISAWME